MTALDDITLTDAVEFDVENELADRFNVPVEEVNNASQDAPWGLKADGTPRQKPGRKSNGTSRPRSSTTSRSSTRRKNEKDYRPAVMGLVQMVAFPLTMAGTANPTLALDGAALIVHSPALADALHEVAVNNPQVAAVLEQLMQIGPYGALIGAIIPMAIQIAHNHKVLPAGAAEQMGALEPPQLMEQLVRMSHAA